MKKKLLVLLSAIIAIVCCVFGFAACDSAPDGGEDNPPVHTHSWSSTYTEEGDRHYQTCSGCDDKHYTQHSYNTDGVCVCGKQDPASIHTHKYDRQVIEGKYLKSAATHATKAIYYLSCECGESGTQTFEYGTTIPHTYHQQVAEEKYLKFAATCTAKAVYYLSCDCGEKGTETFESGTTIPHTFDNQVVEEKYLKSVATCTAKAVYYYSCECGESGTQTFEYGELVPHTEVTDQAVAPTCTETGLTEGKHCSVCNAVLVKQNEVSMLAHSWNFEQLQSTHSATCTNCDGVIATTKHTWDDNVCTVCSYDAGGSKGLQWELNFDNYIVSGIGTCEDIEIVIPATYNGKPVTSIGDDAFYNCGSLTSVTIPDSITSISVSSFYGCSGLESITVGNDNLNYQSIDNCLIETASKTLLLGCKNSVIPLDGSVTSIGYCAFYGCSSLRSIIIPDSVTSIGYCAFYGCSSLTSIIIPDSVTIIGGAAFSGCSSLESITLPFVGESAKTASDTYQYPLGYMFGASSYTGGTETTQCYYGGSTSSTTNTTYYIPSSLKSVTITGGNILYGAFYNCSDLTSVTIPDSVTSIGGSAFDCCRGLKSITIPDSVTSIGDYAFSGCFNLTSVNIIDLTKWCNISFDSTTANPLTYAHNLYLNGELVTDLVIPDSVTSVGDYAFSGCSGLTIITIPDGVTSIGRQAFDGCSGLASITIPDSVTSIGWSAFYDCNKLHFNTYNNALYLGNERNPYIILIKARHTNIATCIIHTDTKFLNNSAFENCRGLTSVTIPNSVTSIGENAFNGCSSLTSVIIPDSVTSIGWSAFYNCSGLTSIIIPDSVTSIGGYAFENCSGLTSITIPDSVTSIGDRAFYGCSGLTSVTIPDGVTSIGNRAFYDCYRLVEVNNKSSLNITTRSSGNGYVGYYAKNVYTTEGGSKLTTDESGFVIYDGNTLVNHVGTAAEVIIPDGITTINDYVFYNLDNITSITIPDSVTSIGDEAFRYCSRLTSITFNGTKAQWQAIKKDSNWNWDTGDFTITCTDGKLDKSGNVITG